MPRQTEQPSPAPRVSEALDDALDRFGAAQIKLRRGASWPAQVAVLVAVLVVAGWLLTLVDDLALRSYQRLQALLVIGGLGMWRWGWSLFQCARAATYRYVVFPALRRQATRAEAAAGPIAEVAILATTYHEKPWITLVVFESVFRELSTLPGLTKRPVVVVVGGCDKDDQTVREIYDECCRRFRPESPTAWPPELTLLRGDKGKRLALASGLKEIEASGLGSNSVVLLMDGDTIMGPGMLRGLLPIFLLPDPVGAVTTNEDAYVHGPAWFAEWISMRLGQRHRTMCAVALSGKILCLTGRLSAFRGSVATDPTFRAQIENDSIDHWLWGRFDMMSGDDKSTWYWLAANKHRMLYLPDVMATTVEVVSGSAAVRVYANLKRWSGNTIRNSDRVIGLGPRTMKLVPWLCTVDQRVCNWTTLVGIIVALLGLITGHPEIAICYILWAMLTRTIMSAMYWRHGRRFSAYYMVLELLSGWSNALIKIWVSSHPAKQSWMNRGGRTMDTTRGSAARWLRSAFADYLFYFTMTAFVAGLGCLSGTIPLAREAPLYLGLKLDFLTTQLLELEKLPNHLARRTIVLPLALEAPLHLGSWAQVPAPGGVGPAAFAHLTGDQPLPQPRTLPRLVGTRSIPRRHKRTAVDPSVPRVGFDQPLTATELPSEQAEDDGG